MSFKRFSDYSLRTQIALVFGALVVGLAVLLSLGFGELLKYRIERDAGSSLQVVAHNAGRLLSNGLHERSREAEVLAASEVIWTKGLDSAEAHHMLARSQATQPHSVWIGVADTQGVVRAATGGLLVDQNVAERPWFQEGLKQLYVGDVHPAKLLEKLLPPAASGEPYRFVDFAAPIRLGPTTVGVLGIHGSWEWTREVIESLTPERSEDSAVELFVFDRQGELIYAPNRSIQALQEAGQRLPEGSDRREGLRRVKNQATVTRWVDGRQYLTAVTPLPARNPESDLGWYVVAREPVEVAFAEAHHAVRMALAIGLAAALLASVLAWLAARRLSEDLFALADAATAVQADRHDTRLPQAHSSREVRELSGALDHMTQRLMAAREALEEKVRLRTLELEAANRALDMQARTDALTGLLNRRGFESQMAFALALARRSQRDLSLIAVDVDHFKRVNDTYGHEAGDEVLRRLGQTLAARLRSSDVVARLGGEEFVALLPDTDLTGAQAIAQALVDAMAEQHDPVVGRITVSAGVGSMRDLQDTGADMLRRADAALYEAKRQGRNRVCVQE